MAHQDLTQEIDLNIAEDDYVSENHAFIRYQSGSLFVFDNGSRNGTFVNQNLVNIIPVVLFYQKCRKLHILSHALKPAENKISKNRQVQTKLDRYNIVRLSLRRKRCKNGTLAI